MVDIEWADIELADVKLADIELADIELAELIELVDAPSPFAALAVEAFDIDGAL